MAGAICGAIDGALESISDQLDLAAISSIVSFPSNAILDAAKTAIEIQGIIDKASLWVGMATSAVGEAVGVVESLATEMTDYADKLGGLQAQLSGDLTGMLPTEIADLTNKASELTKEFTDKWGGAIEEYGEDIDTIMGALGGDLDPCGIIPNISSAGGVMSLGAMVPKFPITLPDFEELSKLTDSLKSLKSDISGGIGELTGAVDSLQGTVQGSLDGALANFKKLNADAILAGNFELPDLSDITKVDFGSLDPTLLKEANLAATEALASATPASARGWIDDTLNSAVEGAKDIVDTATTEAIA
jgi:hypothetical protein